MDEPGECHDVEARIVQHFTRLHGVLQNMQAKLIEQLYHPRTSLNSNLREIEMQLCKQEKQLGVALKVRITFQVLRIANCHSRQFTRSLACLLFTNDIDLHRFFSIDSVSRGEISVPSHVEHTKNMTCLKCFMSSCIRESAIVSSS